MYFCTVFRKEHKLYLLIRNSNWTLENVIKSNSNRNEVCVLAQASYNDLKVGPDLSCVW